MAFFSESAMCFSNLQNKYSKSLSWAWNLNKFFTVIGRKFKFQVQDSSLENLFWRFDKHTTLSEKKLPLEVTAKSLILSKYLLLCIDGFHWHFWSTVSQCRTRSWHYKIRHQICSVVLVNLIKKKKNIERKILEIILVSFQFYLPRQFKRRKTKKIVERHWKYSFPTLWRIDLTSFFYKQLHSWFPPEVS